MKATLEFNTDEPHERDSHLRAVRADEFHAAVCSYDNWLRSLIKYREDLSDEERECFVDARSELWERLEGLWVE